MSTWRLIRTLTRSSGDLQQKLMTKLVINLLNYIIQKPSPILHKWALYKLIKRPKTWSRDDVQNSESIPRLTVELRINLMLRRSEKFEQNIFVEVPTFFLCLLWQDCRCTQTESWWVPPHPNSEILWREFEVHLLW